MKVIPTSRDAYVALLLGLIVGIGLGVLTTTILGVKSKQLVGERVKMLYELANPNVKVDVVDVLDKGNMYEVILKFYTPQPTFLQAYVTKDGKFLTENLILVEESINQIQRMKKFVDCLAEKGVKIYGVSNSTATLLQLNLLGRYSAKLYVSCDGINLQKCIQAGITQVPSISIGGKIEPGVKTIEWFEKQTGCKF